MNNLLLTKEEALAMVSPDGGRLKILNDHFKNDKDVVLAAVKQFGLALRWASKELQNDKEIVTAAVMQEGWALQYASTELKNDKAIIIAAITEDGTALEFASPELQDDYETVQIAINNSGTALQYASNRLKVDTNLILDALYTDNLAISHIYSVFGAIHDDPVIHFMEETVDICLKEDWPIVKQALIENPQDFLNPKPCIKTLVEGVEYPYVMLAQYALSTDANVNSEPYPEIMF